MIPSVSCSSCENGGWFDETKSSTYNSLGTEKVVTAGVWGAQCTMSTDYLQSWDTNGTALIDFEFCLVTETLDQDYPFRGILGFGKPGSDQDAIYGTFVGKMYD